MAKIYGNTNAARGQNPPGNADGTFQGGRKRILSNVFDLSKQAVVTVADVLVLGTLPKGATPRGGVTMGDATMGAAATLAIGNSVTPGKYRAAAVHTAVNTPAVFGAQVAGAWDALTADEEVIITIAAASLPAAGKLYVDLEYIAP
jgi:hypothetical protein